MYMLSASDISALDDKLVQWIDAHRQQLFKELKEAEASFLASGLEFRNTDYKLFPRLLILPAKLFLTAKRLSERLLDILEKVILQFDSDHETREFFQLTPHAQRLASIDPGYRRRIRVSRFDTFLDVGGGTLKVLENNTDCPAGLIFTGRVMQLMQQLPALRRFLDLHVELRQDPISDAESFIGALLDAFHEFHSEAVAPASICLLQPRNRISPEIKALARLLQARSFKTFIADPLDLTYSKGRLMFEDTAVKLIWNKINTVDFDKLSPETSMEPFLRACREGAVCHVNSFQARYITESKLCLAYLSDPRFNKQFTAEELELLRAVIPWTRKLTDSTVQHRGKNWDLRQLALEHREQFVLKAAYDIRGDGVTVGRATDRQTWGELINRNWNAAYILQEYIEPPTLLVPQEGAAPWRLKKFSLDLFMLNGQFQGFGSKISEGEKLNLFQGGSKLPAFSAAGV